MSSTKRGERWFIRIAAALSLIWAAAWIRFGADTSDGGYAVALQLHLAGGAVPFRDELSPQVLGALPAVPFVWVWHELFGLTAIVLASRVFFVILACGVMTLAYRGLRAGGLRPVVAFTAIVVSCIAVPYDLPIVSYNTVPILGCVLSVSCLVAAAQTGSGLWAAGTGAAIGVTAVCSPQYLPAALVVGIATVAWCARRQLLIAAAAALAPLVLFGVWALVVPGLGGLRLSFDYMNDYQSVRLPYRERLVAGLDNLGSQLLNTEYVVALAVAVLVAIALLAFPRSPWPPAAMAFLPVLAIAPVLRSAVRPLEDGASSVLTPTGEIGVTTLHGSAALVSVLLVPCLAWQLRERRRPLLILTTVGLPMGLVMTVVLSGSTSAGAARAVAAAGLATAVLALVATSLTAGIEASPRLTPVGSAAAVLVMMAIATATVFPAVPIRQVDAPIRSGAYAGMVAQPGNAAYIDALSRMLREHTSPGERVLAVSVPAFPLLADVRPETPMLWLSFWGKGNARGIDWLERPGNMPDTVIVAGYDAETLNGARSLRRDPLASYLRDHYTVIDSSSPHHLTVLRRTD